MDALTNTNAPIAYDPIRYGREIVGIPQGTKIQAQSPMGKWLIEETKKFNDKRMEALSRGPNSAPQIISITNDGRVRDVLVKPDGEPVVLPPQTLNTQQGMFTLVNPTNVAPIIDPRTGQQVKGYAAGIDLGEDAAPLGTYTPGQAAAPAQTPSPAPAAPAPSAAPAPAPAPQAPQQAQSVRVISPDGRMGVIPASQVDQAVKQGFQLAP
jgi:hypothetical protein